MAVGMPAGVRRLPLALTKKRWDDFLDASVKSFARGLARCPTGL